MARPGGPEHITDDQHLADTKGERHMNTPGTATHRGTSWSQRLENVNLLPILIGVVLLVALVLLVPWLGPATKSRSGRLARIEGVGGGWAGVNGAGGVDEERAARAAL